MGTATFNNPACIPAKQPNNPLPRATTLCLDLSLGHKIAVLKSPNHLQTTKNQKWAYLSNINPPTKRTFAMQSDIMSNPNLFNLPLTGKGGMIVDCN